MPQAWALDSHISHLFPWTQLCLTWQVCLGSILRAWLCVCLPVYGQVCESARGLVSNSGRWQSSPVSRGFRVTDWLYSGEKQTTNLVGWQQLNYCSHKLLSYSFMFSFHNQTEWLITDSLDWGFLFSFFDEWFSLRFGSFFKSLLLASFMLCET